MVSSIHTRLWGFGKEKNSVESLHLEAFEPVRGCSESSTRGTW